MNKIEYAAPKLLVPPVFPEAGFPTPQGGGQTIAPQKAPRI